MTTPLQRVAIFHIGLLYSGLLWQRDYSNSYSRCCERSENHKESLCDFATCNSERTLTLWRFLWQDGVPSFEAVQDLYLSDNGKVQEFTVMKNTVLASHGR